jgi:hypothetical protein
VAAEGNNLLSQIHPDPREIARKQTLAIPQRPQRLATTASRLPPPSLRRTVLT